MTSEPLPHWDLSNVYPGLESEAFKQAMGDAGDLLDELDAYLSTADMARGAPVPADGEALASMMDGYLKRMNSAASLVWTLRSYIYSFVATNSYNTEARRLMSVLEPMQVRLAKQDVLFSGWMGDLARQPEVLEAALAIPGPAAEHAFYLKETAEQSRYLMSSEEESLAAELSLSGANAWGKLQGVVASQLKVPFGRDGKTEVLPITVIQNLRHDADEDVRRRAYEAELEAWESVEEPLAACLNGVKGTVVTLTKRRGREDALHESLDQSRIDRQTLDAMLGAMYDSFPTFRGYWQSKAHKLGKEALPWWDLFAPVVSSEPHFGYDQAREFILERFGAFSGRLAAFARRAFEHNWIDAEPRDGKRGGAFCMGLPAVDESRVLCNFDGSLSQVLTIAHELGHAYHKECQVGKTILQTQTPMTMAETASIFCETVITDALLAQASEPEEELSILEAILVDASQVVVDIYSRYLFEKEVFKRRADAELSAQDLCEVMVRAQKETYGQGLDARSLNPYMWAWKPHYYRATLSFYNYPYAFGLLFGLGLYAVYQERGEAFLDEYDQLLRSTGEGTAADLAAGFGIDIRQKGFWEGSIDLIKKRIERYQAL
jgi:pepF/M3 family oligoendopeptidase